MMIRLVSMSYVALVAALIFGLYHVKLETKALEHEKLALTKNIARATADIDLLEAEWATRTSPDYLRPLVADHLPAMQPAEPKQLASLGRIPMRAPAGSDDIERLLSMVEVHPPTRTPPAL